MFESICSLTWNLIAGDRLFLSGTISVINTQIFSKRMCFYLLPSKIIIFAFETTSTGDLYELALRHAFRKHVIQIETIVEEQI